MTAAFVKYWKDVTLPCLAASVISPVYWPVYHSMEGVIYGITAPMAYILALRLAVEPIIASQRRAKLALNAKYGRIGYYGGRVEKFTLPSNDSQRN